MPSSKADQPIQLDTLAPETLDHIISHLDQYHDVFNVALVNSALRSVAVPHHLGYRDIRARLNNVALWTSLANADNLRAQNVRSLTIIPHRTDDLWAGYYDVRHEGRGYDLRQRTPPGFAQEAPGREDKDPSTEENEAAERVLVEALKKMTALKRFRWYASPKPVFSDIWRVLRQNTNVEELDVIDYSGQIDLYGTEPAVHDVVHDEEFLEMEGLTALRLNTDGNMADRRLLDLSTMLLQQHNLQTLDLSFHYKSVRVDLSGILLLANWTNLKTFRTLGTTCTYASLQTFLATHGTIEELALARYMMPGQSWKLFRLPRGALRQLRHLECSTPQAVAILRGSIKPKLQTLLNVCLYVVFRIGDYFTFTPADEAPGVVQTTSPWGRHVPSEWLKPFWKCLADHSASITHLGVSEALFPDTVSRLATSGVPNITHFSVQTTGDLPGFYTSTNKVMWERYKPFGLFQHLEVIQGLVSTREEDYSKQIEGLGRCCPKLKVVLEEPWKKKTVIIREPGQEGGETAVIKYIRREWEGSEFPGLVEGETEADIVVC